MVFSSHLFIFYFLPTALILYYAVPRTCKHLVLTLLSYWFYGWANPLFVVLMLGSTLIDYICGRVIARGPGGGKTREQKIAVTISICSNLCLLGFFKYFNFGIGSYNAIAGAAGLPIIDQVMNVTLPLGISFYTFQSMSYSIDIYRGHARPIRNFIDFACYVSMFPQLVAGPIIRFQEVADQLRERTHTIEKFSRGVAFISLGLAKKILIANPCGKVADICFDAGSVHTLDAWYGVIGYSFQIYFDFSAYSDMAIGLGLMLGFVFPKNFDSPYHSKSITEFWRRWHISLSTWLRDYLYIPLGGNRKGPVRTYVNLALVMLLGGLWHGASINFVIWGAIHGVMLGLERAQGKDSPYRKLPAAGRMAITYVLVLFTWVFFRAADLSASMAYIKSMLGLGEVNGSADLLGGVLYQPYYYLTMILGAVVVWFGPQTWDYTRKLTPAKAVLILGLFGISLVILTTQSFNPFIYFIF
jgi:alginate O-acetyltransferase complex protein AlgI